MTKFSIVNSQSSTLAKAKMTVKIAPKKVYHCYDSNYLQQCSQFWYYGKMKVISNLVGFSTRAYVDR